MDNAWLLIHNKQLIQCLKLVVIVIQFESEYFAMTLAEDCVVLFHNPTFFCTLHKKLFNEIVVFLFLILFNAEEAIKFITILISFSAPDDFVSARLRN